MHALGARLRIEHCVVANMGADGVRIANAGEIAIEDSVIRDNQIGVNIALTPANVVVTRTTIDRNFLGLDFQPSVNPAKLIVTASHITRSLSTGIRVMPSHVRAIVAVAHTTISHNAHTGLGLQSDEFNSTITILLNGNTIVHSIYGIAAFSTAGVGNVTGALTENFISDNSDIGILAQNGGVRLVLDRNTVTHNLSGIAEYNGAVIETRSNNTVRENATNSIGGPYLAVGGT